MKISIETTANAATGLAARRIADAINSGQATHLALAGGNTPRPAYERVAGVVGDWSKVELWLGDERMVPANSPGSNYAMIKDSLLDRVGVSAPTLHPVQTELSAEDAAAAYGELFRQRAGSLSIALLGLGEDGHTASLFPGFPQLEEKTALCVAVHDAPKPPPDRVTLTLPVFEAANQTILLATGADKAAAVAAVIGDPSPQTPASLLPRERLELILDEASAALVPADLKT